jgi:hypothetical protein
MIYFLPNVAAEEQRSAAENLFDDEGDLLHPLVPPPVGGKAAARKKDIAPAFAEFTQAISSFTS